MGHDSRSPWRPLRVVGEGKSGRCFACERYLGVPKVTRAFVEVTEPVTVGGETLEPGWYCPYCLGRARRSE